MRMNKTTNKKMMTFLSIFIVLLLITTTLATIITNASAVESCDCIEPFPLTGDDITLTESKTNEQSLQNIIDIYNGSTDLSSINATTDQTQIELFYMQPCMNAVTLTFEYIGKEAGYDNTIGYYLDSDPSTVTMIDINQGLILHKEDYNSFGFALNINNKSTQYYFTETTLNPVEEDGPEDHALVYVIDQNSYLIAFEDWERNHSYGNDFDDYVFIMHVTQCDPIDQYTLTINIIGEGTVETTPDQALYLPDTLVTLQAVPQSESWIFDHWEQDLTGSNVTTTLTMDANKTVTAVFREQFCGSATSVVYFDQGTQSNGKNVSADRSDPSNALGEPEDSDQPPINYVSLGIGGTLILGFDPAIDDGPGDDFRLVETSYGNPNCAQYPEHVFVSVSQDNETWYDLGDICLDVDASFDLTDVALSYARYVRLVDTTDGKTTDGYDVDGVGVYHCYEEKTITINATKIICHCEECLPNWGGKSNQPNMITETLLIDFLSENPCCEIIDDWKFEWALGNIKDPIDYAGDQTGYGGDGWNTFTGTITIDIPADTNKIWVREVLKEGYVPFAGKTPNNNVSAELYAHKDIYKYDNYDFIKPVKDGETYYIVGFNAPICNESRNLVVNGGFEQPLITDHNGKWETFPRGTNDLGWHVEWRDHNTTINPVLELQSQLLWTPAEGDQYAELDTHDRSDKQTSVTIYQDIPTCPGKYYQIRFSFSPRPKQDSSQNILNVSWNNITIPDSPFIASGSNLSDTQWKVVSVILQADSAFTRLGFTDEGKANTFGPLIDNVSVHVICDPYDVEETDDDPSDNSSSGSDEEVDNSEEEEESEDENKDEDTGSEGSDDGSKEENQNEDNDEEEQDEPDNEDDNNDDNEDNSENDGTTSAKKSVSSPSSSTQKTNMPPVAIISQPHLFTIDEQPIILDGSQSYDNDGYLISYTWKLGDKILANEEMLTYFFPEAGEYLITLHVQDNDGENDSQSQMITILQSNHAPLQPIIEGFITITQDKAYSYSAQSNDPDEDALQYIFDWGDGIIDESAVLALPQGKGVNMIHTWEEPGEYQLTITVTDGDLTNTSTTTITVVAPPVVSSTIDLVPLFLSTLVLVIGFYLYFSRKEHKGKHLPKA